MPGRLRESGAKSSEFVSTPQNERLITEMIKSHSVGDFCVVGEKVATLYLYNHMTKYTFHILYAYIGYR